MTIYDIAKIAGVSASTVSRVVNKKPGIKDETRQRIQQLLEEYGYTPNETARGLVNRFSRMIGILVEDIRYSHHVEIAYHIETKLRENGYSGLICNTGFTDEKKVDSIRLLEQRQVDGAILVGSTFQTDAVAYGIRTCLSRIPVVITNGYLDLPNVYGVLVDERDGVENCVELMYRKNHKKLAFVLPNHTPSNLAKQKGFISAMVQKGHTGGDLWLYEKPTSLEGGYAVTGAILMDHPDVEGIIFGEDLAAAGAIRALTDAGVKIPEQVAVIGVDDSLYGEICCPKLTSLNNMMLDTSIEAADILLAALEGRPCRHKSLLFSAIVEREST